MTDFGEGASRAGPLSRGGDLGEVPPLPAERYEPGPVLGWGGMGLVRVAFDHHLGREVALKEPAPGAEAARLAHEAAITARLDHPGIVPIHDLGRRADGRIFYVMRLVRGRSLAVALEETPNISDRWGLLRPLLAVCEAVASAHDRGIVHRDLKPANLMLGPFGEVQVVDWGLAWAPGLPAVGGEGTPDYMSPQQARGEPPRPTDDVFSLGVILRTVAGGMSPELDALVERAVAPDPAGRYPHAGALAVDLAALLDGRRVAAFRYTPWHLLARVAKAWRVPLMVGGLAVALLIVFALVAAGRLKTERDRALAAEDDAARALSRALITQALEAARDGHRAEAELLAVQAGDAPEATGLLLDLAGGFEIHHLDRVPTGPCALGRLSPDGRRHLCVDAAGHLAAGEVGGPTWRRDALVQTARFLGPDVLVDMASGEVERLDGATGRPLEDMSTYWRHNPAPPLGDAIQGPSGRFANWGFDTLWIGPRPPGMPPPADPMPRFCGPMGIAALVTTPADDFILACKDGHLLRGGAAGFAPLPHAHVHFNLLSVAPGPGDDLYLGSLEGELLQIDETGHPRARLVTPGGIAQIRPAPEGVWVLTDRGRVRLADRDLSRWLVTLPGSRYQALARGDDGALVAAEATGISRWRAGLRPPATRFEVPSGLASAAASQDGRSLALLRGDGRLSLADVATGRITAEVAVHDRPLKRAVEVDGRWYVARSIPGEGVVVLDAALAVVAVLGRRSHRRLTVADGVLVALAYHPGMIERFALPAGDLLAGPTGVRFIDVSTAAPLAVLDENGGLWDLDAAGSLRALRPPNRAVRGFDRSADGRVALLLPHGVSLENPVGREVFRWEDFGVPTHLALEERGRLAVGYMDGRVRIFDARSGGLLATMNLHEKRVGTVGFAPPGVLLSAGWDGVLRRIPLDLLDFSPELRRAMVEARWGQGAGGQREPAGGSPWN